MTADGQPWGIPLAEVVCKPMRFAGIYAKMKGPYWGGSFSLARKAFRSSRVDSFCGCFCGSANWRGWRAAGPSCPS
ncbi:hypothetical protein SBA4_290017 [Candidatus Sulfopaludibacter sp. SbA4]|nr:hypothetical protein SBA4_290017 [Candidatus Sulfopaludibacter sp. SbA4]